MSDIRVVLGAVETTGSDGKPDKEMALGIKAANLKKSPMFAIPLSSAYLYADPKYLIEKSFFIAEFLGMFPDQFLVNRIADTILSYLPDLVRSKPLTDAPGKAFAEGELKIDGERIQQFEAYTGGGILT
jgi:hypothetical protein